MAVETAHPNGQAAPAGSATEVTWHHGKLTRPARWAMIKHRGATVWLTGLPASGKSTVAAGLEERIAGLGQPAYLLDGDNLRHGLNADLGFAAEDRAENVRRVAEVARLFADSGTVAIASLISPYAADRLAARRIHEDSGIPFLEVFVNTPLHECERRDPKGLYLRARAGLIAGFTGIDAPYEAPVHPDVELRPTERGVDQLVTTLIEALRLNGVLPADGGLAVQAPGP
jgi:adenylyl-sulfate kinase